MSKNHCELCQPEIFGPWPTCDGLPTWCSNHWREALHNAYGGDDFQRELRASILDQQAQIARGERMWWQIGQERDGGGP